MFTDEELEMLQRRIDDPDWDMSQSNDVLELLPRLLETAKAAQHSLHTDGANVCHIVEHVFIDSTCAMCGIPENRPAGNNH